MEFTSLDTQCVSYATAEERRANMAASLARGYPVVTKLPANGKSLAIVGGGPSVADDLEELRNFKGEIWAVNGSLDWLMGHGIKADGYVMSDAHETRMVRYLHGNIDTTYYIASMCHPSVFEALEGKNVILWHVGDRDLLPPKGQGWIPGGPTVMTRAPVLAHALGYRDVHLYGVDSSNEGNRHHVYSTAEGEDEVAVELDGVIYRTGLVYVHQVAFLQFILAYFNSQGSKFTVHGRGLGPAMMKAHIHSREEALRKVEEFHRDGIEGVISREARELRSAL